MFITVSLHGFSVSMCFCVSYVNVFAGVQVPGENGGNKQSFTQSFTPATGKALRVTFKMQKADLELIFYF